MLGFLPSLASRFLGERMSRPTGKFRVCLLPGPLLSSEIILPGFDFFFNLPANSGEGAGEAAANSRNEHSSSEGRKSGSPGGGGKSHSKVRKYPKSKKSLKSKEKKLWKQFRVLARSKVVFPSWKKKKKKFQTSRSLFPEDGIQSEANVETNRRAHVLSGRENRQSVHVHRWEPLTASDRERRAN